MYKNKFRDKRKRTVIDQLDSKIIAFDSWSDP